MLQAVTLYCLNFYSIIFFVKLFSQFGIPNSRLRYYLLAKRKPLQFCFAMQDEVKLEPSRSFLLVPLSIFIIFSYYLMQFVVVQIEK